MNIVVALLIYFIISILFQGTALEIITWVVGGVYKRWRGRERKPNTPSVLEEVLALLAGPIILVLCFLGAFLKSFVIDPCYRVFKSAVSSSRPDKG